MPTSWSSVCRTGKKNVCSSSGIPKKIICIIDEWFYNFPVFFLIPFLHIS
jgi:hypothetical protein